MWRLKLSVGTAKLVELSEKQIRDIFGHEHHYQVPKYQREYSWSDEQISEFMSDLFEHVDNELENYYYFGTIYLIGINDKNEEWMVVDGQQRITTSLIFLTVVRDIIREFDKNDYANEIDRYIKYQHESEYKIRLELNTRNNDFFKNNMMTDRTTDQKFLSFKSAESQNKNLVDAYTNIYVHIQNKINKLTKQDIKLEYLKNTVEYFLKYFIVTQNIVESHEVVQEIFDTVNHRGIQLSEMDFVKNEILELIEQDKDENEDVGEWNQQWIEILNILNMIKVKETQFLRHYLLAYHKKTAMKNVANTIISIVEDGIPPTEFIKELRSTVTNYAILKNPPSFRENRKLHNSLNAVISLESQALYPALLVGYEKLGDGELFIKLTDMLVKYFFRARTIYHKESHNIENAIVKICVMLRTIPDIPSQDVLEGIKNYLHSPKINPSDDDFVSAFKICTIKNESTAIYILSKLNEAMSGHDQIDNPFLEYIMPKMITDTKWDEYLRGKLRISDINDRKIYHLNNLYKIGNMTLLNTQHVPSSDYIDIKISTIYNDEKILMTNSLKKFIKWDEEDIKERQEMFSKLARKIWQL